MQSKESGPPSAAAATADGAGRGPERLLTAAICGRHDLSHRNIPQTELVKYSFSVIWVGSLIAGVLMHFMENITERYAKRKKQHDRFLHRVTKYWMLGCKKTTDYAKNVEILQKSGIIKSTKSRMPLHS